MVLFSPPQGPSSFQKQHPAPLAPHISTRERRWNQPHKGLHHISTTREFNLSGLSAHSTLTAVCNTSCFQLVFTASQTQGVVQRSLPALDNWSQAFGMHLSFWCACSYSYMLSHIGGVGRIYSYMFLKRQQAASAELLFLLFFILQSWVKYPIVKGRDRPIQAFLLLMPIFRGHGQPIVSMCCWSFGTIFIALYKNFFLLPYLLLNSATIN